jgi:UDP-glucose 4-epimerase
MKVTITGGCGFIGSRLAKRGIERGWEITVFDDFSRFSPTNLGRTADYLSIIQGNVEDRRKLGEALRKADIVFHLGGISRAVGSTDNPQEFFETNVAGTHNVYESCRGKPTRIIFPSSWIVYSQDTARLRTATKEDHRLEPKTPYALSKLFGEEYARLYRDLFGESIICVRLSNVYGPGDKDRIIPNMIDRALKGNRLRVNGTSRLLNFIYVEDVVDAMVAIAESPEVMSRVYNIGTQTSTNLFELAKMINKECGSSAPIDIGPQPELEASYYCPDTSLAVKELGFVSKTGIVDGVHICVESARRQWEERTDYALQNLQEPKPA